jgi:hypothetical protein
MLMKSILIGAAALAAAALAVAALGTPASAQHVITNPGWCAQFYPNANCQNYGPGNPYTGNYQARRGWYGSRAQMGHRMHRKHWRRYR